MLHSIVALEMLEVHAGKIKGITQGAQFFVGFKQRMGDARALLKQMDLTQSKVEFS